MTFRDYFAEYRQHPEAKAAGPHGQPCQPHTQGLLRPVTIQAAGTLGRIGKETNRVNDDTDLADLDDAPVVYAEQVCRGCGNPVRPRQQWCSEACRKHSFRRTP
jgi:hypothetical protein